MRTVIKRIAQLDIFDVLSEHTYIKFTLSVIFSQLGYNIMGVSLIFLIFYRTNSNFLVSLLILTYLLPQVLLSFLGGVVADLHNKKKILVYINIVRALAILILFFNSHSVFLIYFVSVIISVATQFYIPAESPMIPTLVKKENLVPANSIFGIALFGSILISYILAGPLITILGRDSIFLVISALFASGAFFVSLVPYVHTKKNIFSWKGINMKTSVNTQFKESLIMLKNTGNIATAFLLLTFSQVVVLILASIVPGYARDVLSLPAEDLSIILFAPAALGMIIAAVFIGTVCKSYNRSKIMTYGIFISGVVLLLFPFTSRISSRFYVEFLNLYLPQFFKISTFHLVNILAFFAGVANAMIFIPAQTIIQELTPENFQSKIYGLLFAMIGIVSLVPIIITGTLADLIGVGTVLFSVGIVIILIGVSRTHVFSELVLLKFKKR